MCLYFKYGTVDRLQNKNEYRECNDNDIRNLYTKWIQKYKELNTRISHHVDSSSQKILTDIIDCYCGYDHRKINDFLRNGTDISTNAYREKSDILLWLIMSAPKIPNHLILYRSVDKQVINEIVLENKRNIPFCDKGFLSCSLEKKCAHEINTENPILKIYLENSVNAIFADLIHNRGEKEIILPTNGFLKMIDYPYHDIELDTDIYECSLFYFTQF